MVRGTLRPLRRKLPDGRATKAAHCRILTVSGPRVDHIPFTELPLPAPLQEALAWLNYTSATPIQAKSLPPMLAGRDVMGQARTGTGKTAAYGLALLARIDPMLQRTQALVLCHPWPPDRPAGPQGPDAGGMWLSGAGRGRPHAR